MPAFAEKLQAESRLPFFKDVAMFLGALVAFEQACAQAEDEDAQEQEKTGRPRFRPFSVEKPPSARLFPFPGPNGRILQAINS